ncbi:TadE family protein [Nocardioides sp.]|uniref:TadE family protein n=1 Tax=Nocardioides sp. TaxID=35761 RepID=UPI002732E585|nr:TadE/TadG family type IV pilus assembly protein [Nocardioides sp.]MDP3893633.1 TadE/TadG family type IV pilus assembly protein [Nocardioides sp.]
MSLELVVLFPAVLLLIFGIIQAGLVYHARNVALAAAQEGVRAARAENGTAAAGAAAANSFVEQAGGQDVLRGLTITPQRTPTRAVVRVRGRSLSVLPGVPGIPVTQVARAPVERVTTSGGGP